MKVRLGVIEDILAHANEESPRECCGLLIGTAARIERSARARNAAGDPFRRFLVDPADHFAAIRSARAEALDVVGAYHSHPAGEPVPSPTDLAEANQGREFVYVIVSPVAKDVRAYRIDEGTFTAEALSLEPST